MDLVQLIVFILEEQRYGLPLQAVDRAIGAVGITPLPRAPEVIEGVINMHGEIIPVINMRRRFGLPERPLDPQEHFIIASTRRRRVALRVDAVVGLQSCNRQEIAPGERVAPGADHIAGVVRLEEGLTVINDLDRFLSLDEEAELDEALGER